VLVSKQNSTGSLHVWWLHIGRIEPREAALLGKSAEIGQISGAPGWTTSLLSFFSWWNKQKRVPVLPLLYVSLAPSLLTFNNRATSHVVPSQEI